MKLMFLVLLFIASSCIKVDKEENRSVERETRDNLYSNSRQENFNQLILPNHKLWDFNRVSFKKSLANNRNEIVYRVTRTDIDKTAYVIVRDIPINTESKYELSILVRKGEVSNYFGMRVMGVYPNRIDAVFDLKNGKIKGIQNSGDFKNGKAFITSLDKGWYKCSLVGKFNSDLLKLIFGPTSGLKKIVAWEAPSDQLCDNYLIPSSLILEDISR